MKSLSAQLIEMRDNKMPSVRGYTLQQVAEALSLRAGGLAYKQVAAQTGIPSTTVFNWNRRYLADRAFRALIDAEL